MGEYTYNTPVRVDRGVVSFHARSVEPTLAGYDFRAMLLWSEDDQCFGIATGTMMGAVELTVTCTPSRPPVPASNDYELIEEASGRLLADDYIHDDDEMTQSIAAILVPTAPGIHRLRLLGVGRETPLELQDVSEPILNERYLLQIWPEPSVRLPLQLQRVVAHPG